jgi:hypothetical protein
MIGEFPRFEARLGNIGSLLDLIARSSSEARSPEARPGQHP